MIQAQEAHLGNGVVVEVRTLADVSPPIADFEEAPFWWNPESLPDAKVLHVKYKPGETMRWYIVSRQTGVIYCHPWSS
jgi:hypothetical protein